MGGDRAIAGEAVEVALEPEKSFNNCDLHCHLYFLACGILKIKLSEIAMFCQNSIYFAYKYGNM